MKTLRILGLAAVVVLAGVGTAWAQAAATESDVNRLDVTATEIARLLRLYQIGAMVLIDFVSMDSKAQRTQIAEAFDAASVADPRPF